MEGGQASKIFGTEQPFLIYLFKVITKTYVKPHRPFKFFYLFNGSGTEFGMIYHISFIIFNNTVF